MCPGGLTAGFLPRSGVTLLCCLRVVRSQLVSREDHRKQEKHMMCYADLTPQLLSAPCKGSVFSDNRTQITQPSPPLASFSCTQIPSYFSLYFEPRPRAEHIECGPFTASFYKLDRTQETYLLVCRAERMWHGLWPQGPPACWRDRCLSRPFKASVPSKARGSGSSENGSEPSQGSRKVS